MKTTDYELRKLAARVTYEATLDLRSQLKAILENHRVSADLRDTILKILNEIPYLLDELYLLEMDINQDYEQVS